MFLFSSRIGVVSWYLGLLGYDWNHALNSEEAMGLVVLASTWGRISYNFLFFLAGLQAIPKSIIEAAAIDGASFWKRFGSSWRLLACFLISLFISLIMSSALVLSLLLYYPLFLFSLPFFSVSLNA